MNSTSQPRAGIGSDRGRSRSSLLYPSRSALSRLVPEKRVRLARIHFPYPVGRTEPRHRTGTARGLARVADPPAVEDHAMRQQCPVLAGEQLLDLGLHLHRIFVGGPAEAPRQPPE